VKLSRLFWRVTPIFILLWATRTGTIEWRTYFRQTKGVVQVVATEMEMAAIAAMLKIDSHGEGRLPTEANFSKWLKRSMKSKGKEGHLDHFGRPYLLEHRQGDLILSSAGIDKRYGTRDDIERTIRIR
jgi:hypothetical protein